MIYYRITMSWISQPSRFRIASTRPRGMCAHQQQTRAVASSSSSSSSWSPTFVSSCFISVLIVLGWFLSPEVLSLKTDTSHYTRLYYPFVFQSASDCQERGHLFLRSCQKPTQTQAHKQPTNLLAPLSIRSFCIYYPSQQASRHHPGYQHNTTYLPSHHTVSRDMIKKKSNNLGARECSRNETWKPLEKKVSSYPNPYSPGVPARLGDPASIHQ